METREKKIIILGAAGDGRNIADTIEYNILAKKENLSLIGYLDDNKNKQNILINNVPTLGPLNNAHNYADCLCAGESKPRS